MSSDGSSSYDQLKTEILQDLRQLLSSLHKERSKSKLRILNSPFAVTFLGGLLIMGLGILLQSCEHAYRMSRAKAQAERARKEKLYCEFAQHFDGSLSILVRRQYRVLWLVVRKHHTDDRYPDSGKSFREVADAIETLTNQLGRVPSVHTLCAQIEVVFGGQPATKAEELRTLVNRIDELTAKSKDAELQARVALAGLYIEACLAGRQLLKSMLASVEPP